jgi:hypothetical protein
MKRLVLAVAVALAGSWPIAALGQDKDQDAERLFREGQRQMEERRYGEACPKFEAAYQKDQQLGTLLNLAYCHKEQGAIWQAWLEFREAEVKAVELKRPERRDFARARMAELEKSLARVVVDPPARGELSDVLVEDRRVPEAERGAPFAAEPGQRKLTFRAKGKKPATQLVVIAKAERVQHVAVPELEDLPKESVAAPPARKPAAEAAREDAAPQKTELPKQRLVALAVGGAGTVAAGIGSVFGILTFASGCSALSDGACSAPERSDASETGAVATVAFASAGVLLGAAAALWFTAPRAAPATAGGVQLRLGGSGLQGLF